jgi:hypothetical protein
MGFAVAATAAARITPTACWHAFTTTDAAAAAAAKYLSSACAVDSAPVQGQACACCVSSNQLMADLQHVKDGIDAA